mmetsp:Transcript_39352/g.103814  ORF Transcript_39352/g.103814 Transcript_39352/m.103814 type:complete len:217 (+) Transcript_39352:245-895(+)
MAACSGQPGARGTTAVAARGWVAVARAAAAAWAAVATAGRHGCTSGMRRSSDRPSSSAEKWRGSPAPRGCRRHTRHPVWPLAPIRLKGARAARVCRRRRGRAQSLLAAAPWRGALCQCWAATTLPPRLSSRTPAQRRRPRRPAAPGLRNSRRQSPPARRPHGTGRRTSRMQGRRSPRRARAPRTARHPRWRTHRRGWRRASDAGWPSSTTRRRSPP